MESSQIGKRAWSYAGVLQQAGLSCVEYVEQNWADMRPKSLREAMAADEAAAQGRHSASS